MLKPLLLCFDFLLTNCLKIYPWNIWSWTCWTSNIRTMIWIKIHTCLRFLSHVHSWESVVLFYFNIYEWEVHRWILKFSLIAEQHIPSFSPESLLLLCALGTMCCILSSFFFSFFFFLGNFPVFIFRFCDKSKFHLEFIYL